MREVLTRLYALGPGRMLPGRERLARLLSVAGNPQLSVPSVLVGGTNGKGRLVTTLSAVLSRRYRCGAFIKPHLKSIRERWRLGDTDVDQAQFSAAARQTLDLIDRYDEPISFFEANVLLGALLFRDSGCEIALWEVGLGGRQDACNLVDPLLSVITNVQYDHQAILGENLAQIAEDKAYICRSGRPLLLGPPRPGWEDAYSEYAPVIARVCAEQGAKFEAVVLPEAWPALSTAAPSLPLDTLALLETALAQLASAGFPLSPAEMQAGLGAVRYRGRMERGSLRGQPVILDAAHNQDSLRWLARELAAAPGYPVVFGCQATRDPAEMLRELKPVISTLTPIEVPVLHPCPLQRIIDAAQRLDLSLALPEGFSPRDVPRDYEIGHVTELDPPDNRTGWIECVSHALTLGSEARPTVLCGSIYNLGEILRVFE